MRKTLLASMLVLLLLPAYSRADVKTDRIILGYSACWRDAVNPVSEYDFDHLNFICRSFLQPLPDGSIGVPDGYFNAPLVEAAHQHGVKMLLSIGGGDAKAADWVTMATHPDSLAKFLDLLDHMMSDHHFDGVDVDWEPADPTKVDGDAYCVFLKALRAKFPQTTITTALPTDPYQTRFTPWPDVIANVTYINVMAYDYSGPWGGIAGDGSNLFPAGDYPSMAGHSVAEGMDNLLKNHGVPANKILMGMTFWGYRYRADHLGDSFKANSGNVSDALSYQQIHDLMSTGHYQYLWDEKAAVPYLQRTGGGSVVCFENAASIRRKCEYAKTLGCAGMMIWNVGSDLTGAQAPLMDAIVQSCGGARHPLGRAAVEAEVADASSMLQRATEASAAMPSMAVPTVPPALSTLSIADLEWLNAQLQFQAGVANDALWQKQGGPVASH